MRKLLVIGLFLLCSVLQSRAAKVREIVFETSVIGLSSPNVFVNVSLFTPVDTGLYRVTIYEDMTPSTATSGATVFVQFTSVNGASVNTSNCQNPNGSGSCSTSLTVRAIAGNPISVQMLSGNPSLVYDLYVVVEKLF